MLPAKFFYFGCGFFLEADKLETSQLKPAEADSFWLIFHLSSNFKGYTDAIAIQGDLQQFLMKFVDVEKMFCNVRAHKGSVGKQRVRKKDPVAGLWQ